MTLIEDQLGFFGLRDDCRPDENIVYYELHPQLDNGLGKFCGAAAHSFDTILKMALNTIGRLPPSSPCAVMSVPQNTDWILCWSKSSPTFERIPKAMSGKEKHSTYTYHVTQSKPQGNPS